MSKIVEAVKNQLITALQKSYERSFNEKVNTPIQIEVPADSSHGDFASNIAMTSVKLLKMPPKKIAETIASNLDLSGTMISRCEIAGPGFMNFFLDSEFYTAVLKDVHEEKDNYGRSAFGENKRVQVEFVSANPTGPMHLGNARGGALGDCLASVLDAAGYTVEREFYINDTGNQIDKFAKSLEARYLQIINGEDSIEFPEDGYHGDDIKDLAQEFFGIHGTKFLNEAQEIRRKALVDFALPKNIEKMKTDLEKYRIKYDEWFPESRLHNSGEVLETINVLKEKGLTYDLDGALWYKATQFGSEKDEVLIRKNGIPTYFAADIAYHRNKLLKRKFDLCIDIWGADHHGHVARVKGAMDAIGLDSNRLDIILIQLVRLVRDGEVVRMSKRTGKAIQLADLLEEVPVNAARFIFNLREANSQMDFDLDLAVKEDSQNPVYYVQYAYARICSIIKNLAKDNIHKRDCSTEELKLLNRPEEIELIKHIAALTDEIILAAKNYNPSRITRYVIDLATLFHKFYNSCYVKGEEESLMYARLFLCTAVKTVIKNVLRMFKIDTPECM